MKVRQINIIDTLTQMLQNISILILVSIIRSREIVLTWLLVKSFHNIIT